MMGVAGPPLPATEEAGNCICIMAAVAVPLLTETGTGHMVTDVAATAVSEVSGGDAEVTTDPVVTKEEEGDELITLTLTLF